MDFKLPIYCVGVTQNAENVTRIAILQKTCKAWRLCRCEELAEGVPLSLPKRSLSLKIVLSLQGRETLVKSVISSLKSKKYFLKMVYAEQEATAALPLKNLVVTHSLGKWNSHQERAVTLWMLQRQSVVKEMAVLEEKGGIATTISCRAKDIFSALQHSLLHQLTAYFFVYESIDETICIFVQEGSLLLSRGFRNDATNLLDDLLASFVYVQETYKVSLSEIHGAYLSNSLRILLSRRAGVPVIISPLFPELSADQEPYRDAVAAAYHEVRGKDPCFSYGMQDFSRKACRRWLQRKIWTITKFALAGAFAVFVGSGLETLLVVRNTRRVFEEVSFGETLPYTLRSAQQVVKEVCDSDHSSGYEYFPTVPTSQEVMEKLGQMTEGLPSLSFSRYVYKLENIPYENNPSGEYRAYVSLQGFANDEDFSSFVDKLSVWLGSAVLSTKLADRNFDVRMALKGRG